MKKLWKWGRRLLLLLLAGVLLTALVNGFVILSTRGSILSPEEVPQADCILVLGCGLFLDGTPGNMLTLRLDTAIELYQQGAAPKLLMSGDHSEDGHDEVNAMKRYAVEQGVPPEDVFMDHAGYCTRDSMIRARDIFGCESVIVVTQGYHLYRALWTGQRLGMRVTGVAAAMYPYGWRYNGFLHLREYFARIKDFALSFTNQPAAVMGEPVSLLGSGAVTDDETTALWLREMLP